MYKRSFFVLLVIAVALCCSCITVYNLELKFTKGEVLKYQQDIDNNIVTSVMSIPMNIKQKIKMNYDQETLSTNSGGERKLKITMTRIMLDMNLGFLKFQFDTQKPDAKFAGIGDMMRKLINHPVIISVDEEGKITQFEGLQEMIDSLSESGVRDPGQPNFGSFMTKDFVKGLINISYFPLPADSIQIGDTWTKSRSFSQMNLGDVNYKETLTLEKVEDSVAFISSVPEVSGDILDDEKGIDVPGFGSLKAKSLDMKASYEFDLKKGIINSQHIKSTMSLEGKNPNYGTIPITINSVQETNLLP